MTKLLQEMNWSEVKELIEKSKVAIIPTGSTEQHGPHLPLGTDYLIAEHIANKVAKEANVLVTPVIPIGYAPYHTDYPGTLSIPMDVLTAYYTGIVDSLIKHGMTHILFLNGHGGNSPALSNVCFYLRMKGITAAYINWFELGGHFKKEWGSLGHADHFETSVMLSVDADTVDMKRADMPVNKGLTEKVDVLDGTACSYKNGIVRFSLMMKDVTDNGAIFEYGHSADADYSLDVRGATAENGEEIVDAVVEYVVDFVEEFRKINFETEEGGKLL